MGLSTKKHLNENSTATSSQQENTSSKEMARKHHVNKETFLYRTELKTKPMEYSAQLKITHEKRFSKADY